MNVPSPIDIGLADPPRTISKKTAFLFITVFVLLQLVMGLLVLAFVPGLDNWEECERRNRAIEIWEGIDGGPKVVFPQEGFTRSFVWLMAVGFTLLGKNIWVAKTIALAFYLLALIFGLYYLFLNTDKFRFFAGAALLFFPSAVFYRYCFNSTVISFPQAASSISLSFSVTLSTCFCLRRIICVIQSLPKVIKLLRMMFDSAFLVTNTEGISPQGVRSQHRALA